MIAEIHSQISEYLHKTPVLQSTYINQKYGLNVFFKCENFQKTGSFKMRGAINALNSLSKVKQSKGVITHSSGNFAQALAKAGQLLGVKTIIVMPHNAAKIKVNAVKSFGAKIYFCEPTQTDREKTTARLIKENAYSFIHPSNDMEVIKGQGTACFELLTEYPQIQSIISPVGGGGLLAGTILATANKDINVYGAEPENVSDAYESLKLGAIVPNNQYNTIADGLRTQLGDINFPIIKNGVEEIILVSEQEIKNALIEIWQILKIVIEPSSAVAFAALTKSFNKFKGQNVGIILSGGNIDMSVMKSILADL